MLKAVEKLLATSQPLFTSWPVVCETIDLVSSARGRQDFGRQGGDLVAGQLLERIDEGFVKIVPLDDAAMASALRLRIKHGAIKDLSLTD